MEDMKATIHELQPLNVSLPNEQTPLKASLQNFVVSQGGGGVGKDGKSAYEIAVDNGFEGNETEWLASLQGEDGRDGVDGKDGYTPIKGVDYFDGKDGEDGYTPIKGVDYFDGKDGVDGVSGVYVGSGDMPDGYNVQIDPNGNNVFSIETWEFTLADGTVVEKEVLIRG